MAPNKDDRCGGHQFILTELQGLKEEIIRLQDRVLTVQLCVAGLKVKASVWGLVAGTIPVIVLLGINFLKQ